MAKEAIGDGERVRSEERRSVEKQESGPEESDRRLIASLQKGTESCSAEAEAHQVAPSWCGPDLVNWRTLHVPGGQLNATFWPPTTAWF